MNDEQLLLFRKILNIRNYSQSTISNYNNALIQFKKWNYQEQALDKDLLFKYVEHLRVIDNKIHLNIPFSTIFEYQITDIRGNLIQNGMQSQTIIDVSQLASGTYLLLITNTYQSKSYKLMIFR